MGAPEPPPLRYAQFVDGRPWLALCAVLALPLTLSAIAMPRFSLNDLEGWDVRASDSSMALDAWREAEAITFRFAKPAAASGRRRHLEVEPQRSTSPRTWTVYMEDLSAHKDMLRKEALSFQRAFEARLRTTDEWLNHCLLDSGGVCVPPNSLVADLATTTTSSFSSTTAAATITAAERERVLELAHTSRSSRVTNEFDDPASGNASAAVKSTWLFGLPIAGYTSANQAASVQSRAVDSSVIRNGISLKAEALLASAEFRNVACFNACEQGKHEFRVVFDYPRLNPTWATRQLAKDGPLAGFSMLFVLCVMTAHTRSFTIASVGMLQILLSFPTAYFFYRIVCGILHFGTLQVLAVYVILGIGADDIFVLFDAFQQAPTQHGSAYRLSWALRRAVSAMTVTSLTTFAAFLVTALSPITNIKVFGIFASVLVLTNFLGWFVLCLCGSPYSLSNRAEGAATV